jgi:hypothetical protein
VIGRVVAYTKLWHDDHLSGIRKFNPTNHWASWLLISQKSLLKGKIPKSQCGIPGDTSMLKYLSQILLITSMKLPNCHDTKVWIEGKTSSSMYSVDNTGCCSLWLQRGLALKGLGGISYARSCFPALSPGDPQVHKRSWTPRAIVETCEAVCHMMPTPKSFREVSTITNHELPHFSTNLNSYIIVQKWNTPPSSIRLNRMEKENFKKPCWVLTMDTEVLIPS